VKVSDSWNAFWIWLERDRFPDCQESPVSVFGVKPEHRYAVALFRKEVVLPEAPSCVAARVSADCRYRLYVNGTLVGRGPAEVGGDYGNIEAPNWWFYDTYDLTAFFRKGPNVIAAEVALRPEVQAHYSMGHGGFLFEASVDSPDGDSTEIVTDDTWRGTVGEAFVQHVGLDLRPQPPGYDARLEPVGWQMPGFDDRKWPTAQTLCDATGGRWRLVPREIPPLREEFVGPDRVDVVHAAFRKRVSNRDALTGASADVMCITPGSPVTVALRFAKEVVGYARFTVSGSAGTILRIGYQEVPGREDYSETYVLRDGEQTYESMRLNGFQHLKVTVTFCSFDQAPKAVMIRSFGVNFTSYPVTYRGRFRCSDPLLNRIWEVGRWTTQLCMQSYHLDSPIHQEGLGCTGDYMIQALISYVAFGEVGLARQDLLRTAWLLRQKRGIMFHTSYSLLWLHMLYDYVQYTGDTDILADVLPEVHLLLERFAGYRGRTGLITESPDYMFMDWVEVDVFNMHHPPAAIGQGYMTAFYYRALLCAARVCRIAGDKAAADGYERVAEDVKAAFNRELWAAEKGLFRDGLPGETNVAPSQWLPADPHKEYFSLHTNALAVLYGIAPEQCRALVLERALGDASLPVVQPYFLHYVLNALAACRLFDKHGFALIRRWKALLDEHDTSWKEAWHFGDYSHAWGGTPTYQLSSCVLGITPAAPGFKEIRIQPCCGSLRWAKGCVPTPRGEVSVAWRRTDRALTLTLTVPEGCRAAVYLPKLGGKNIDVHLGSKRVWHNHRPAYQDSRIVDIREEDGSLCFVGTAGNYRFRVCGNDSATERSR